MTKTKWVEDFIDELNVIHPIASDWDAATTLEIAGNAFERWNHDKPDPLYQMGPRQAAKIYVKEHI